MNAKLLEEATFQHLIRQVIKECLLENIPDKRLKWELIKIRVKAASIKYGVERASKRKNIIKLIQKELDEINKLEDEGNIIDINRKEELKNKMENYYNEKMDGYLIRSKINWVKEGEKCTSYFFNLEKQRQKANVIHRLKNKEGDIKTKDSEILGIASNFYTELLISRNISQDTIDRYLNETNISNVLSEDQKIKCDAEITEVEVKYTIDALKSGKSPGSDGLIPEFYKCFWNDIKKPFMDMIQETYEKGELPYTMRLTILALLYKKNDAMLLKNYRPISLTNYDYKILAFVLANRVQNIAKYLINPDQSAYIKGRFIGDNARLIEDYFEYCEGLKVPGILLFLDYEKAFDSLEWNFMFSVLEKFNFGQNFIKWVKILYTNPLASIKNNGWLSKTIALGWGVRQGCPLSCLLFVLSVEVLATKLRSNGEIKGFKTPSREIKTSLYADDNTLLLDGLDSLEQALEVVRVFSDVAGPKINLEKSEGILLGPLKNTLNSFKGVYFTNEAVRCLGIYVGHNKDSCFENNWTKKLDKIETTLEAWKKRDLSLFGKILVLKSLALSKVIYSMTMLVTPDEILKKLEKIIFSFLWGAKDRIKRKTVIGCLEKGGINVPDIFSKDEAIKAAWVRRILSSNNNNIRVLDKFLKKIGLDTNILLKFNVRNPDWFVENLKIPRFWAEVFSSYNKCKYIKPMSIMSDYDYLTQTIWGNSLFQFRNNPIFISNWVKSNIIFVKDLYQQDGTLKTCDIFLDQLNKKQNWIQEYSIIKKVFGTVGKNFRTENAIFTHIKDVNTITYQNQIFCSITQKSKFYYKILVHKKYQRNYMEGYWGRIYDFELHDWSKIYIRNVASIPDNKIREFKYKLLTNTVYTRNIISKWDRNVTENCPKCGLLHNPKHLLFECQQVNNLWIIVGTILNMDITYKIIIFGNDELSDFIKARNLVISYITYGIYKMWILHENKKLNLAHVNLIQFTKKHIFEKSMLHEDKFFKALCDKVIMNL